MNFLLASFTKCVQYKINYFVPQHDMYGKLPGYLGKKRNSFVWVITSSRISKNKATISLINDYGSEDLTATLIKENDSIYTLKQGEGSALKIPRDSKWQRLPSTLQFKRKR